jgi:hypothetical protein
MVGDRVATSLRRVVSPNFDKAVVHRNTLGLTPPLFFPGDIPAFIPLFSKPEIASQFSSRVNSFLSSPVMLQSCYGLIGNSISCESNR